MRIGQDTHRPLVLYDGNVVTDGGHAVFVQYVDIRPTKRKERPPNLVKAIEAEYGIEYSPTMRISAPRRFQEFGETFIQDHQEGRAQHQLREETVSPVAEERLTEQQRALSALGRHDVKVTRSAVTNTQSETESATFGKSAWIYCTSILPPPEKRKAWREHLPESYDHETIIRQPTKFAQALGLMVADQIGPQGQKTTLTHGDKAKSIHDGQMIFHGPVFYTEDVLSFLQHRESDLLYWMYPLFLKDARYKDQREYRFVVHCEVPVEQSHLDLRISGMLRDSLVPIHFTSSVEFQAENGSLRKDTGPATTGPTPKTQTTTKTRRSNNRQRWTVKVRDVVEREEVIDKEQVIQLTTESPWDGTERSRDALDSRAPAVAEIAETEIRKLEVSGVPVEESKFTRTRIAYIRSTEGADDFFRFEERDEATDILEAAKQPFRDFAGLPSAVSAVLLRLVEVSRDLRPKTEVHVMSALWNSIWAVCNLYKCFGDIVGGVGIERDEFVAVVLKRSDGVGARGKLLVGPRGTYAYMVQKGDNERYGHGGEDTQLLVFPDETTQRTFEEFGWSAGDESEAAEVASSE